MALNDVRKVPGSHGTISLYLLKLTRGVITRKIEFGDRPLK